MQIDSMDPSLQAEAVLGAGRGALVIATFGAAWLAWGLVQARMFRGVAGAAVGLAALFLWACAIYAIRKGRILRKQYPLVLPASERRAARRSYLFVVLIELLALVSVLILANRIHRPDLGVDWFAMVVGLHFLPLAKTFRAPALGIFGILIALWCLLCWGLFRSNALAISAALGTGILLWTMSGFALFSARKIARALGEA